MSVGYPPLTGSPSPAVQSAEYRCVQSADVIAGTPDATKTNVGQPVLSGRRLRLCLPLRRITMGIDLLR